MAYYTYFGMYIQKDMQYCMCHMKTGRIFDGVQNVSLLISEGSYFFQKCVHTSVLGLDASRAHRRGRGDKERN